MMFTVFSKTQLMKAWYLLCFGRRSRAEYVIYGVFEGWAEQKGSSDFSDFADEVGDSLAQPTF